MGCPRVSPAGRCRGAIMWFDRRSVADRALVARHTKRKQEAEAEHDAPPQGRMTLELRAGSVVDDAPEERPFGRSLRASLGPAWAALHTTARGRHGASRNDAIKVAQTCSSGLTRGSLYHPAVGKVRGEVVQWVSLRLLSSGHLLGSNASNGGPKSNPRASSPRRAVRLFQCRSPRAV